MERIFQCSHPQPANEWVKGKVIGSGSHGAVHLAMDKATGALFVVKHAHSGTYVDTLKNEASILESLDSPHIVRFLGKKMAKGSNGENAMSVFMEYIAGGSLSDIAEKFGGSLDEETIRLYTKEILHGLNYLHQKGIVHSDVKCKNVLLGSSGNIKLADFGCARRIDDLKRDVNSERKAALIGGTPLWMAPEVLRKERLDFASDIWSLGCTVVEMATGRPPWSDQISDNNPMSAVLKIASSNEKPQFPIHFSKEGLDFLANCFDRNPDKRRTAEQLLNHPFISGHLKKRHASSPASVFEVVSFYDSDESEISKEEEEDYKSKNPFSTKHFCENRIGMLKRIDAEGDHFGSSEYWITVRSN